MNTQPIFIIAGEQGAGKTTKLLEVLKILEQNNVSFRGFIAEGKWVDNLRSSFSIIDLNTKEKRLLCQGEPKNGFQKVGRFFFDPKTIEFGEKVLFIKPESENQIVVIDEIGMFELDDKIWADVMRKLLQSESNPLLITVRKKFVNAVIDQFKMKNVRVYDSSQSTDSIAAQLVGVLKTG